MSSSSCLGWTSRLDVRDHLQHLLTLHPGDALPAKVAAYLASLDPGEHVPALRATLLDRGAPRDERWRALYDLARSGADLDAADLAWLLDEDRESSPANVADLVALARRPAAIETAWRHLDRLSPKDRAELLVELVRSTSGVDVEIVDRLYDRFRYADRPLLAADADTRALAIQVLDVTCDRRASRLALIDAWASSSGAERVELLEIVAGLPELIDFVATRPAALEEAALALALPFRVLVEHLGPAGLRRRIVTRILTLRDAPATLAVGAREAITGAAGRAVELLASSPDAPRTACLLLAAMEDEAIDGDDVRTVVEPLVGLLWERDRAQTVELGRAALRRCKHDDLAHHVLSRVARSPREEDRPFLDEAIAAARERRAPLITLTVTALVRLGAPDATWRRVADAIVAGENRDLCDHMAIAAADETTREARLVATMLDGHPDLLRLAALDHLARARSERHLSTFERAMTTNLCCGMRGCTQIAERAVEVVVGIGTVAALAALVRAFVALGSGPEQVIDAIGAGIVSLAGRLQGVADSI